MVLATLGYGHGVAAFLLASLAIASPSSAALHYPDIDDLAPLENDARPVWNARERFLVHEYAAAFGVSSARHGRRRDDLVPYASWGRGGGSASALLL